MIYVVRFNQQGDGVDMLFAYDTDTGTTAKDVLHVPGVLDNLRNHIPGVTFKLKKLDGTVGNYRTAGYGLTVEGSCSAYENGDLVSKMLTVPPTAAQSLMATLDDDMRGYVDYCMKAVSTYEAVNENSKLCLPADCLTELDPALAEKLMSTRKTYVLRDVDNQEIFQADPAAEYGVQLPSLEAVHGGSPEDAVSALDLLRVVAPYRRQESGGYSYKAIYHTPYFKVDPRLRGMVPNYLEWINGYSSNDLLDIQPNEQRMAKNLYTYICSDTARYVVTLVSGIFFDTALGSLLNRLCSKRSSEVAYELCEDIRNNGNDDASCDIPLSEVDALVNGGWYNSDIAETIKKNLKIRDGYLRELILARPVDRRIIDCSTVPFSLPLTDDEEREFTELLIENGFLSQQMRILLVTLCKKAYRVNWGHTGAVLAIPGFVDRAEVPGFDTVLGDFVRERIAGRLADAATFPTLYPKRAQDDDDDLFDDGGNEEIFSGFEYYITTDTMNRMINGSLPDNFFYEKASPAVSTEAAIVEYWRNINGENQLDNLLFHAYLNTCDPRIYIESFIKLMRWGERKPKLLVLQHHPEVRMVLDLNTGMMVDNTTLVDENDLVKVNGCDYSLTKFLTTNTNPGVNEEQVIGFVLTKDYGNVKKEYLASWVDVGEMCASGNINIGEFVLVKPLGDDVPRVPIEEYEKGEYQFYVSDNNIEDGLRYKIQPADLCALALMVQPGITTTASYLRSLKNQHIITSKDRQYDILSRYVNALKAFLEKCRAEGWNMKNTVQLKEMSLTFLNLYHGEDTKGEANAATAQSSLSKMNFDAQPYPVIQWDTTPLEGKFIMVTDKDARAGLPPIQFTDPALQNVAARTGNRIVLLLLQADGKFIFCRKDLAQSEVMLVNTTGADGKVKKSIAAKKYEMFAAMFDNLQRGVTTAKISGLPAVLHESLKDVLM